MAVFTARVAPFKPVSGSYFRGLQERYSPVKKVVIRSLEASKTTELLYAIRWIKCVIEDVVKMLVTNCNSVYFWNPRCKKDVYFGLEVKCICEFLCCSFHLIQICLYIVVEGRACVCVTQNLLDTLNICALCQK